MNTSENGPTSRIAWSVDVPTELIKSTLINIVSGLQKRTCEKVAFHPLRNFTGEAYEWIQYIDRVLYSSRYRDVHPPCIS
jgi:hypothetical protein